MASFRSIYSYWYKSRESTSWLITLNLWAFFNIRYFKKIITSNLLFFIESVKQLKLVEVSLDQGSFFYSISYVLLFFFSIAFMFL